MKAIGIIPARYDSTRFPGKPLAKILNKPMIQHVYNQVLLAGELEKVIVATDDERIADCVKSFFGNVMMTSSKCNSGTERIIEIAEKMDFDIFVNIQGDEPLISPGLINELVKTAKMENYIPCVTAARICTNPEEWSNPNTVKVVLDKNDNALYFSRSPIPYPRSKSPEYLKHIGIYTYTKELLKKIKNITVPEIELAESLEQLRILYSGEKIKVIKTEYDTISVDIKDDIKKVENLLLKLKII